MSLSYKVVSLDDEGFGYAKKIQTALVPSAAPSIPRLKMWQPSGDLARDFEENARQRKCFLKEAELKQLAANGLPLRASPTWRHSSAVGRLNERSLAAARSPSVHTKR